MIVPGGIESTYPYTDDGIWPGASVVECHDDQLLWHSLQAYGYYTPPYFRHGSSLSSTSFDCKTIATADVLSQGRVILGCGVGWMSEEMEAIGTEPFQERGKVTDEYIRFSKNCNLTNQVTTVIM